jgi:hypothetical protein
LIRRTPGQVRLRSGDRLEIDGPNLAGPTGLGSNERRRDDPARQLLDGGSFAVVQATANDSDLVANRQAIAAPGG